MIVKVYEVTVINGGNSKTYLLGFSFYVPDPFLWV